MKSIWIEEPINEEFEYEIGEDEESNEVNELSQKAKALAKQISRRLSMAVIVKWLYHHTKEPHRQNEISEALKLDQGTVSFNLNRLANVGVVKITRLKGLDIHPLYEVNPTIGKLVTQRYLWLCSFKLLKVIPKRKESIYLDEIKGNIELISVMQRHRLSFEEAIESLRLNSYIEVLNDRIKLKETLPLKYYKTEEKKVEEIEVGAEELIEEL